MLRPTARRPDDLLAAIVALGVVLGGCEGPPRQHDWGLAFEDPGVAAASALVEALVLAGGCAGAPIYRADVPQAGTGPAPPALAPGRYGLAGIARDGTCRTIARGCVEAELPLPEGARVVVPLATTDEHPACAASQCRAGRCEGGAEPDAGFTPADGGVEGVDAGAPRLDAGSMDAGVEPLDAGERVDAAEELPDAGPPDAGPDCGLERDGRCYRRVVAALPWAAAQRACVVWGGHLVIYEDADEELSVEAALGHGTWIGLSDEAREGVFEWVDGRPLGYARWRSDAPRSVPPWRDCVEHTATGWLDRRCEDPLPYVCER